MRVPEYFKPLDQEDRKIGEIYLTPQNDRELRANKNNWDINLSDVAQEALDDESIFYISFRPDYSRVRAVLYRKVQEWDNKNRRYSREKTHLERMNFTKVDGRGKSSRIPFERRRVFVLEQFHPNAYNDFEIRVGIDPDKTHDSWDKSSSVDYNDLLPMLIANGYDPLLPIRVLNYRREVASKMAAAIIDELNKRNVYDGRMNIKRKMRYIAREIKNYVCDYIKGGVKPPLAQSTLWQRAYRKEQDPTLYGGDRGINEALYETGQLHDAIYAEVIASKDVDAISKVQKKISESAKENRQARRTTVNTKFKREENRKELSIKKVQKRQDIYAEDDDDTLVRVGGKIYHRKNAIAYINTMREKRDKNLAHGRVWNYGFSEEQMRDIQIANTVINVRGKKM